VASQGGARAAAVRACVPAAPARPGVKEGAEPAVVTVASGNLAMIYLTASDHRLTAEDVAAAHPDLLPGLARHPGVGFVVVDSAADGPVAIGATGRHRLRDGHVDGIDPLARYGPYAARDLLAHQRIAHVGDIVVVSRLDRGTDEVAAFEELVGSHGGIGGWQADAVLVHPATWRRDSADLVGPDAVYRQLVDWLEELGLRGAEPTPEPVSTLSPAPAPDAVPAS